MNNFFHKNNVILLKKKKDHIIKVLMHGCSPLLMTLARAAPNLKSRGSNICLLFRKEYEQWLEDIKKRQSNFDLFKI